jgi:hypothetical protein
LRRVAFLLAATVVAGCVQNLGKAEITCTSGDGSWTIDGKVQKDGDTYIITEDNGGVTRAPVADCQVYVAPKE